MIKLNKPASLLRLAGLIFLQSLLLACNSSKNIGSNYTYFQEGSENVTVQQKETLIQPYDLLSINVYSRTINQEQATIFNIPTTIGTASPGYQVSLQGTVEIPVIGAVQAVGLTKDQLQASLVQKLTNYVKNPSVIVRFLQFNVNVIGEVASQGTKTFTVDKVTIIDALSAAGGITESGKLEDVLVIREENGKKQYTTVDMRSKNVFSSPVYVLQPHDIVYVAPTKKRLRTLNADTETQRKIGMYSSYLSILFTIVSLVIFLKQ